MDKCAASASHWLREQDMLMLHHCDRMLAEEPQNDRLPQDWRKYRLASQADTGTRPLQNRPCPRQPPFARVLTVLLPINAIQIVWVNLLC